MLYVGYALVSDVIIIELFRRNDIDREDPVQSNQLRRLFGPSPRMCETS